MSSFKKIAAVDIVYKLAVTSIFVTTKWTGSCRFDMLHPICLIFAYSLNKQTKSAQLHQLLKLSDCFSNSLIN